MKVSAKCRAGRVCVLVFFSLLFFGEADDLTAGEGSPVVEVFEALDNRSDSLEELRLRVRFNRPMDKKSVELATSMLHEHEFNWPFTISWEDDATMVLKPSGALKKHVPLGIIIRHEATTQDGFGLERQYVGYIMTGLSRPSILETEPKDGAEWRSSEGPIKVAFSQGMDQFSTESAFSLQQEGQKEAEPGKITWNEDNTSLLFTPDRPLQTDARYVCTISTAAHDVYAQGMPTAYVFRFSVK